MQIAPKNKKNNKKKKKKSKKNKKDKKKRGLPGDKIAELKGLDSDQILSMLIEHQLVVRVRNKKLDHFIGEYNYSKNENRNDHQNADRIQGTYSLHVLIATFIFSFTCLLFFFPHNLFLLTHFFLLFLLLLHFFLFLSIMRIFIIFSSILTDIVSALFDVIQRAFGNLKTLLCHLYDKVLYPLLFFPHLSPPFLSPPLLSSPFISSPSLLFFYLLSVSLTCSTLLIGHISFSFFSFSSLQTLALLTFPDLSSNLSSPYLSPSFLTFQL